jgi:plastocyanin
MIEPLAWSLFGLVLASTLAVTVTSVVLERGRLPRTRAGSWWPFVAGLITLPFLAVAASTCAARPPPTVSAVPCTPAGQQLQVQARHILFHTAKMLAPAVACLAVNPGVPFTIAFSNRDPGIRHNLAILMGARMYSTNPLPFFTGHVITGPSEIIYQVSGVPPGTWTFQCDIHPMDMMGLFVVPDLVTDSGFRPPRVEVPQGYVQYYSLAWYLPPSDRRAHALSEASGVFRLSDQAFDSGRLGPGASFQFRFFAAGTYAIVDGVTGAASQVGWPMTVTRSTPTQLALQWAILTAPGSGTHGPGECPAGRLPSRYGSARRTEERAYIPAIGLGVIRGHHRPMLGLALYPHEVSVGQSSKPRDLRRDPSASLDLIRVAHCRAGYYATARFRYR